MRDERTHRSFVAVALGDDPPPQRGGQGIHFEMCGRALDLVDDAADMCRGQGMQSNREPPLLGLRRANGSQEPVERSVLAEEQDLFLAGKVVIEVGRRQVGGNGNLPHAGRGEPAAPEHARRGAQDVDPALLGAPFHPIRTTVRKSNHGSIVACFLRLGWV